MYSCQDAHGSALPKPTRYLFMQTLCGLCGFGCCQMPSGGVECTEEESKNLGVPTAWRHKQGGVDKARCFCLTDTGCRFGVDRPVLCKLYPLQYKDGKLIVNYWSIMHCPTPKHFELVSSNSVKFVYRRRSSVGGGIRYNCQELVTLSKPIELFPNVLESCREAVDMLWGAGAADRLQKQLSRLQVPTFF